MEIEWIILMNLVPKAMIRSMHEDVHIYGHISDYIHIYLEEGIGKFLGEVLYMHD